MNPRIAIFLPNLAAGGAERVMVALAGNFAARGIDCDLVLVRALGELLASVPANVRVIDLQARKPKYAILPLANYLRKEKPSALLASLPLTSIAALIAVKVLRASRARTVIRFETRGDLFSDFAKNSDSWIDRLLKRALYRTADASIAVSQDVREWLARENITEPSRTHVVHNPLIIPDARSAVTASRRNGDTIIACGRLIEQKDYPTLLRAFARLHARRRCNLVILGTGPMREALAELASSLGIAGAVVFEGFVADPIAYLRRADVFVHTSLFEGFGNVFLEALFAGCAIVAVDAPGAAREVLGDGRFGVLVPVGDDAAVAAAVESILDRKTSLQDPSEHLRQFGLKNIAERHLALLLGSD